MVYILLIVFFIGLMGVYWSLSVENLGLSRKLDEFKADYRPRSVTNHYVPTEIRYRETEYKIFDIDDLKKEQYELSKRGEIEYVSDSKWTEVNHKYVNELSRPRIEGDRLFVCKEYQPDPNYTADELLRKMIHDWGLKVVDDKLVARSEEMTVHLDKMK